MRYPLNRKDRLVVLRIVGIYALFGALWIYLSDSVLGFLIRDPDTLTRLSVVKGLLFILLTALLLSQLIGRYVTRLKHVEEVLEEKGRLLEELNRSLEERVIMTVAELRRKDQLLIQQSRMAAMGEMLGNIAHQWRQPLNLLALKVQELGLRYECGEFSKELLDANIDKAMEIILHLSQTIDDFRDFSSPDKKKDLFSVEQVIAKTVSLVKESFKEQRIAIEVQNIGDPRINGYPNEYAQVLLNILMNARDASQERGTENARITVRSWTEKGRAVVTVADNAGGIGEEIMDRIFDAYFTTKELGKGTGVGLFMSKTIIEKNMGGRLTARNVGGGAEFRIEV